MKELPPEIRKRTEQIIDEYSDMIFRIAFSHTGSRENAEDICQEVFLRYMKKCPEFLDKEHEKAWLIRVTINESKNLFASVWMRRTTGLTEELIFPEKDEMPLLEAVKRLPVKYRIPLYLHYYEGYSVQEVAKLTGKTKSTIGVRLMRARELLRKQMEEGSIYGQTKK